MGRAYEGMGEWDQAEEAYYRALEVDENLDEAVELLTGVPAGEKGTDGRYPEGTVNRRVDGRLLELARKIRDFTSPEPRK